MGATPKRFAEICFFAFLALVTFVLTEAAYQIGRAHV